MRIEITPMGKFNSTSANERGLALISLQAALELGPKETICLVGGGGKTTAMYRLSRELAEQGNKVIVTTTTKIWPPENWQRKPLILSKDCQSLLQLLERAWDTDSQVCMGKFIDHNGKIVGLEKECLNRISYQGGANYILCEADGSKGKPIKAAADHEPVIPGECSLALGLVGWDALHQPLREEFVHRAELFSELTAFPLNKPLTPTALASILLHPRGTFKGVPVSSRRVCLINKIDHPESLPEARGLAKLLLGKGIEKVLLCSLHSTQPVWEVLG